MRELGKLIRTESSLARASTCVVLGTVQFGMPYGRRRHRELLDERVVQRILDTALEMGIRVFDTAEDYDRAPERLAAWMKSRGVFSQCEVVTKVAVDSLMDEVSIERAVSRFDGVAALTILSHGVAPGGIFSRFASLAGSLGCQVGQSVYTADEVRAAASAGADRVQAPVNAFDTRQLEAARQAGIALDARSVYLQGVLLESPVEAEQRVPGLEQIVRNVRLAARQFCLRPATALLASVIAMLRPGDRVVVGVDSAEHLRDVESALSVPVDRAREFFEVMSENRRELIGAVEIVDPRRWRNG